MAAGNLPEGPRNSVLINTGIKKVDHVVCVVKQVHCTKSPEQSALI